MPVMNSTKRIFPPGPKRTLPLSGMLSYRHGPLPHFQKLASEFGDISYFTIGPQEAFFLNHPDLIKDVLVTNNQNFHKGLVLQRAKRLLGEGLLTSEGNFHRRQRRLAQPAFHKQRIAGYAETMVQYTARARDRWRDGETLDVSQEMMRLTLAIVAKTLFDADVEAEASEIGKALTDVMQLFDRVTTPFAGLLEKRPLPSNIRWLKAKQRLDSTMYRIINERRVNGEDRGDLLSMLLVAQDEEGDGTGITPSELPGEAKTLFVGGG